MAFDDKLVRSLVATQFPHWADLPLHPVKPGGWDHKIFRLGDRLAVRLPSAATYERQVEKEWDLLPALAPFLPLKIPIPVATGKPASGYPWKWSIYEWIAGETAALDSIADLKDFAVALAQFLIALQAIDPARGPPPGPDNFYRGGSLHIYDAETRQAIELLGDDIETDSAVRAWDMGLQTGWNQAPVWVHGDVSPGNLLIQDGRLTAVIDFGLLAVGDPACDLAIAWTLFDGRTRVAFRNALPLDDSTWARGRAWALWKALIVASGLCATNAISQAQSMRIIDEVLGDEYDA